MATQDRPVERRLLRQPLPPCDQCASTNVHVATRVDRFIYLRCRDCLNTWSIEKPVRTLASVTHDPPSVLKPPRP
jgi:hypothetical protein